MATKMTEATATTQVAVQHDTLGELILSIFAAMFLGFGVTLLGISAAYVQDLETLRKFPESVWLFVCGVPTEEPMVLPLLISLGVLALIGGAALVVIDKKMPAIKQRLISKVSKS